MYLIVLIKKIKEKDFFFGFNQRYKERPRIANVFAWSPAPTVMDAADGLGGRAEAKESLATLYVGGGSATCRGAGFDAPTGGAGGAC